MVNAIIDYCKQKVAGVKRIIYPITKIKAVYDDDGTRLDNKLTAMQEQLDGVSTEIGTTIDEAITQRAGEDIATKEDIKNTPGDNLLKNSNFKINTNGLSKYEPSAGYLETVNKWEIANGVMYGGTLEVVENGIKLTNVKTEGVTYICQFLYPTDEFKARLNEKVFTFSAEIDGIVYSLTTPSGYGVCSRGIPDGKMYVYKNNNGDKFDFAVRIDTMNGTSKVIKWAKFEPGLIATEYIEPDIEIEKVRCGVYGNDEFLPLTGGMLTGNLMLGGNDIQVRHIDGWGTDNDISLYINWFNQSGDVNMFSQGACGKALHTGISAPVKIQSTAPSDTTSLWYNPSSKALKTYIDGAWT